jgi:hypothetical protein
MLDIKKDEVLTLTGKVSKQSREFNILENAMANLRQQRNKELSDLTEKLERAIKLHNKQKQRSQEAIVEFQSELTAKKVEIEELQAEVADVKQHLQNAQYEIGITRDTTPAPQALYLSGVMECISASPIAPVANKTNIAPAMQRLLTVELEIELLQGKNASLGDLVDELKEQTKDQGLGVEEFEEHIPELQKPKQEISKIKAVLGISTKVRRLDFSQATSFLGVLETMHAEHTDLQLDNTRLIVQNQVLAAQKDEFKSEVQSKIDELHVQDAYNAQHVVGAAKKRP